MQIVRESVWMICVYNAALYQSKIRAYLLWLEIIVRAAILFNNQSVEWGKVYSELDTFNK